VARTIRRAGVADAPALSELGAATFADTFGHLYSAEDLAAFLAEHHTPQACAKTLADPGYAAWLLEDGGVALGYVLVGPCGLPHADVRHGDGELKRLYLRREAQNGGDGARLFDAAMDWLERDGPRPVWLSVWSENFGAQRFYARRGFAKAGEYEFVVGRQRDHEFIYRRAPGTR
jgi:ribosomal protein S18 acetylase RimI-like enzyme